MGVVAVALAVPGVLRPAGGPLVSPQSHGPVCEHRHSLSNPPAGSETKQREIMRIFEASSDAADRMSRLLRMTVWKKPLHKKYNIHLFMNTLSFLQ